MSNRTARPVSTVREGRESYGRVGITVSQAHGVWLDSLCEQHGLSRGKVVEALIERHVRERGISAPLSPRIE